MSLIKKIALSIAAIMLAACGFHLRGSGGALMNFQTLSIIDATHSHLASSVSDLLRNQVALVTPPALAQVNLELGEFSQSKAVSTKNSWGQASEYRLNSSVTIQAYDANKNLLIPPVSLSTTRTLSSGNGYDTGLDLEETRLYSEMDNELASLIQYRLRAIKLKSITNTPATTVQPKK